MHALKSHSLQYLGIFPALSQQRRAAPPKAETRSLARTGIWFGGDCDGRGRCLVRCVHTIRSKLLLRYARGSVGVKGGGEEGGVLFF